MAENTNIEWCDHSFNFVRGCRKKSAGCTNCYAETMSGRNPAVLGEWGPNAKRVFAAEAYWWQLRRWNRQAKADGRIARVFVASLADVFEGEPLPAGKEGTDGPRTDYLPHLERLARETSELQNLRILVLTKRPVNMLAWFRARGEWPWNWWAGTSVEDQKAADERIGWLLKVPASVRFLSMEPLLGPVDLMLEIDAEGMHLPLQELISWVIVGGESGHKARPMDPDWVRSIRDQCVEAGVPFLLKQWGAWAPFVNEAHFTHGGEEKHPHHWLSTDGAGLCWILDSDGAWSNYTGTPPQDPSDIVVMGRHGKKASGRELDGRTWDQVPEVTCD